MTHVPKSSPSLRHYRELDGVRGIAALAVFFHHVCYTSVTVLPAGGSLAAGAARVLHRASAFGNNGVDLFFVLSGFLITSLLIKDRNSPQYFKDFYWKRALRILPLYFLCLAGISLLLRHNAGYILLSLAFLANFAHNFHIAADGPFWSLAIEEQFYLIWPGFVRRMTTQRLTKWAAAIWVATIVLRLVAGFWGHFDYLLTPLRADGLAAGALLACWNQVEAQGSGLGSRTRTMAVWLAAGAALAVAGYQGLGLPDALAANLRETGVVLVAAGLVGLLIAQAGSPRVAVFRSRPLIFFGLISYAMSLVSG
jgi:peptidoglycan/LPS O-acetylase OafA/YrhL